MRAVVSATRLSNSCTAREQAVCQFLSRCGHPLLPLCGKLGGELGPLLLELDFELGLCCSPSIVNAARERLVDPCGRCHAVVLDQRAAARVRCPGITIGTEVGEIAGRGNRAHALLAPRIHCLRMAAACSSSKSIICSSRFCGVRPSLLGQIGDEVGRCCSLANLPAAAACGYAGRATTCSAAARLLLRLRRVLAPESVFMAGRRPNQISSSVIADHGQALTMLPV